MMKQARKFFIKGGWLLLPGLVGFMLFYVIPFLYSFFYSVIKSPMDHTFVFLDNFIGVIKSRYFRLALKNTSIFSLISVPVTVIFSYLLALIQLKIIGRFRILRLAFILPVLLPVASVAIIFKSITTSDSMLIMYLFFVWKNCGLNMIILLAALLSIPKELYEASALDGIGRIKCFLRITLPMTFPSVFFTVIWTLTNSFRIFKELYLWYGAYPDESRYMLQHYMNNHYNKLDYQTLSSGAIIFFAAIYIIVFVFYKSERKYGKNLWD